MNAADNGAATISCPRCQTANTSVARFCLTCGSPLQPGLPQQSPAVPPPLPPSATPGPPPIPPARAMPPMPPIAPSFAPSGFMSGAAAGGVAQATLNMDVATAFNAALQAIQDNGGTVQAHQPPSIVRFQTGRRSFWGSAMLRMKFDGDLTLSPMGPRQTTARVALKLNSGSSTMLIAMDAIALGVLLLGAIMAKNFMLFAFIAAIAGVQYWIISTRWPSDLAQQIVNSLMMGQGQSSAPVMTPSPAPVPPAIPINASHSTVSAASDKTPSSGPGAPVVMPNVLEQLKQLAGLRDAGVVTAEEFESKKADLLKRL